MESGSEAIDGRLLLNTKQAAAKLGVSPSWLEHARTKREKGGKEGPDFVRIGGKGGSVRDRPIALEAFVSRLQEETLSPPRRGRGRPKKRQVH